MSKGPHPFKESDIVRACNAAKKAGITIASVEIDKNGKINVIALQPDAAKAEPTDSIVDLDRELKEFQERHGQA